MERNTPAFQGPFCKIAPCTVYSCICENCCKGKKNKHITFIVLRFYTFIDVFMGIMFGFYQNKKHKDIKLNLTH